MSEKVSDLFDCPLLEVLYKRQTHRAVLASVMWPLFHVTCPCQQLLQGAWRKAQVPFLIYWKILVEHYFNNYQTAPLPPACPYVRALPPELGWRVERWEPLGKKSKQDEPLLSTSRKRRLIVKWVAWQSKVWYKRDVKHNPSSEALLCDGCKAKEDVTESL